MPLLMKEIFGFKFGLVLLFLNAPPVAIAADLFSVNVQFIEQKFETLDEFEDQHLTYGVTIEDLSNDAKLVALELGLGEFPDSSEVDKHPVLGIPSFLFGLALGPVGVAIVGISSKSGRETGEAALGMITFSVTVTGIVVFVIPTSVSMWYDFTRCYNVFSGCCWGPI